MVKLLLKCENCFSYTFSIDPTVESDLICKHCEGKLKTPHPPKFSLDNKYGKYLRKMKKENAIQNL